MLYSREECYSNACIAVAAAADMVSGGQKYFGRQWLENKIFFGPER